MAGAPMTPRRMAIARGRADGPYRDLPSDAARPAFRGTTDVAPEGGRARRVGAPVHRPGGGPGRGRRRARAGGRGGGYLSWPRLGNCPRHAAGRNVRRGPRARLGPVWRPRRFGPPHGALLRLPG